MMEQFGLTHFPSMTSPESAKEGKAKCAETFLLQRN